MTQYNPDEVVDALKKNDAGKISEKGNKKMKQYTIDEVVEALQRMMTDTLSRKSPFPLVIQTRRYPLPFGEGCIEEIEKKLGNPKGWQIERITEGGYIALKLTEDPQKSYQPELKCMDIRSCARCGQDHDNLVFAKLHQPQEEWSYWCLCPTTGEPIMMAIEEE